MYTEYELRQVPLTMKSSLRRAESFLSSNSLRLDDVDYMAAIYPLDSDEMLACGGIKGNLLKCIAVSEQLRDTGMSTRLVSHLVTTAMQQGYRSVKVFTKPSNQDIFSSLGFHLLASSPKAILMENSKKGIEDYTAYLRQQRGDGKSGVIVMNCNPFTKGHRYLVEQASQRVDSLFIIPVREDVSLFSYAERKAMIQAGVADISNVQVLEGSEYSISQFTFPTYFLKDLNDAADTHITLDLDLFASQIAPALGVSVRFVGSEPTDALTKRYNELMQSTLPPKGIEVVKIERCSLTDNTIISASSLRKALQGGMLTEASAFAYPTSIPYMIGYLATRALQIELDTTPKPGLVDQHDNGAHSDMDYRSMCKSIEALYPYFVQLAVDAFYDELPSLQRLQEAGLAAEKTMLAATHGVNTHKGALFSMGLAVCAASHLFHKHGSVTPQQLQETIQSLATLFPTPQGTHGAAVVAQHHVSGALACAVNGYPQLFESWLPYFQNNKADSYLHHKLLLLIMSTLDDTNIYHRAGVDGAEQTKRESKELLTHFSEEALQQMNQRFVYRNWSPGGSADMLSLTIFVASVVE